MAEGSCPSCVNSVWCDTWSEWKCKKLNKRIYGYKKLTNCKFYSKRPKNFKEPRCQCKDCLNNEFIWDEEEGN